MIYRVNHQILGSKECFISRYYEGIEYTIHIMNELEIVYELNILAR